MEVRSRQEVRLREESFGGVCYVPHRDDFFALDKNVFALASQIPAEWQKVPRGSNETYASLAKLGICQTRAPMTREVSYSGPSFVGSFREIVTAPAPLVINCFASAYCPLKCVYCHADDLMQEFRESESDDDIDNVAATASLIPAMVAVITGGDPPTRPERSAILIERLASQKALVLDTSGVGNIESLLPLIKKHNVHVRVSLDAVSEVNNKLRKPNKDFVTKSNAAFEGAVKTIEMCLAEGVAVTVQSVVTAMNEDLSELRNLRYWLVEKGVRHWVLHITVKGGSARRIEDNARRQKRPQGIVPSQVVYTRIKTLIDESSRERIPIDIRCTDTGNTPNSVLLIGSNGDLYTEGLAHSGKVRLFKASEARPDLIREFWHHVDPFGHARRYLNWNPWFYEDKSLEELCYRIPMGEIKPIEASGVVEIEAKYRVDDVEALKLLLSQNAEERGGMVLQRDEYYDTRGRVLQSQDFVVRIRRSGEDVEVGLKGARFRTPEGEYSRIELEFDTGDEQQLRDSLASRDLECTWYFEKRRSEFMWRNNRAVIVVDEVPAIGYFLEVEGEVTAIREVEEVLGSTLGAKERGNYRELYLAHMQASGVAPESVKGAEFGA